jgi:hypothetical protein
MDSIGLLSSKMRPGTLLGHNFFAPIPTPQASRGVLVLTNFLELHQHELRLNRTLRTHTQAQAREAPGLWQGEHRFTESEGYGSLTKASKRSKGEEILFHLKIGRAVGLTNSAFS